MVLTKLSVCGVLICASALLSPLTYPTSGTPSPNGGNPPRVSAPSKTTPVPGTPAEPARSATTAAICDDCLTGVYVPCKCCPEDCCGPKQDRCCCLHVDKCTCGDPAVEQGDL